MQTISLRGKVDKDGLLRLQVSTDVHDMEVDVVMTVQPRPAHPLVPLSELAGAIDDETFVEPTEIPFEVREPLQ